jgi:hypothetical protein
MQSKTDFFLGTLEILLSDNLTCLLPWNHASVWQPFLWNSTKYGKLNALNLLKSEGWIEETDLEIAVENWQRLERRRTAAESRPLPYDFKNEAQLDEKLYQSRERSYQDLLNLLQDQIMDLKVYKLSCSKDYFCHIILGTIQSGRRMCVTQTVPLETPNFDDMIVTNSSIELEEKDHDETNQSFLNKIQEIINELDPIKIYGHYNGGYNNTYEHEIICELADTEVQVIEEALLSSGLLEISEFQEFYPDSEDDLFSNYFGDIDKGLELYGQYQNINDFFRTNFKRVVMYEFSFWKYEQIYILGQSDNEDWVGMKLTSEFEYNP